MLFRLLTIFLISSLSEAAFTGLPGFKDYYNQRLIAVVSHPSVKDYIYETCSSSWETHFSSISKDQHRPKEPFGKNLLPEVCLEEDHSQFCRARQNLTLQIVGGTKQYSYDLHVCLPSNCTTEELAFLIGKFYELYARPGPRMEIIECTYDLKTAESFAMGNDYVQQSMSLVNETLLSVGNMTNTSKLMQSVLTQIGIMGSTPSTVPRPPPTTSTTSTTTTTTQATPLSTESSEISENFGIKPINKPIVPAAKPIVIAGGFSQSDKPNMGINSNPLSPQNMQPNSNIFKFLRPQSDVRPIESTSEKSPLQDKVSDQLPSPKIDDEPMNVAPKPSEVAPITINAAKNGWKLSDLFRSNTSVFVSPKPVTFENPKIETRLNLSSTQSPTISSETTTLPTTTTTSKDDMKDFLSKFFG